MSLLNRLKGKASGGGGVQQQKNSSTPTTTDNRRENVTEGFLCPDCRINFNDPTALERHFIETHSANTNTAETQNVKNNSTGSFVCPQCMVECKNAKELQSHFSALHEVSENRDGDVLAMRMELNDLRAALKEEKWYSEELKKELDKLHSKMQENIKPPPDESGDELGYYLQQIQVLEAGKALVTSRLLESEKQCSESQRVNENIRREKDRFLEKSANLSQELASTMSQLDETTAEKQALNENLTKLQEKIVDLEAQLNARPSEDDVNVLRKELIHAQTLMDQLSRESENEATQWQNKCSQLENKCTDYEEIVKNLTQKMETDDYEKLKRQENVQKEFKDACQEKQDLIDKVNKYEGVLIEIRTELDQLKAEAKVILSEKISLEEKLKHSEEILKNEQETKSKTEKEINELRTTLNQVQLTLDTTKTDFQKYKEETLTEFGQKRKYADDLELEISGLKGNLSVANSNLNEMTLNYKNLKETVDLLKSEREEIEKKRNQAEEILKREKIEFDKLQKTSANDHQQKVSELEKFREKIEWLENENKTLEHKVTDFLRKDEEKTKQFDELKTSSRTLESKCEELTHEFEKKCSKIADMENLLRKISEEKENLSKEKKEMVEKLKAGEGVTTALQQLSDEKDYLEKKIVRTEEELADSKTKLVEKTDELQQMLRQANQKLKEGSDERAKLQCEFNENLTKITAASNQLEKERDSLTDALKKKNENVQELKDSLDEMTSKLESEVKITQELNEKLGTLQTNLNEKTKELETLKNNLDESKLETSKFVDSTNTLEKNLNDLKEKFDLTSNEKEKTALELKNKNDDINRLRSEYDAFVADKTSSEAKSKSLIDDLTRKCDDSIKELQNFCTKFELASKDNEKLKEEIVSLKSTNEEITKRVANLNNQLKERDQISVRQKEETAVALKSSQEFVSDLKAECLRLQEQLNVTLHNSKQETNELTTLVTGLETTVEDLKKQIKTLESRELEAKTKMEHFTVEMNQFHHLDTTQKQKIATLENELHAKMISMKENLEKIQHLEKEFQMANSVVNDKKKEEEKLKQSVESLKRNLETSKNVSEKEICAKNEQVQLLQTNVNELNEEIDRLQKSSNDLATQIDQFNENHNKLTNKHSSLISEHDELKRSYADLDATKIQLESLLKDVQRETDAELNKERSKNKHLEEDKNQLTTKCKTLKENLALVESRLEKSESDHREKDEMNKVVIRELESECSSLRSQMTELQSEKHEANKQYSTKLTSLENSLSNVNETLTKLQSEFDANKFELESTKKDLKLTTTAKLEMEAQLTAWSEEKRNMLERCVMFEKEVEEEKDNARELKRRLDDAISAMHELGRENQSLQIDMSKHFNRKWADDNEAVNCNSCGKQFSVTVRKHHCRHCGMIFCNECSSKSCLVASSKKPVRVCDNCFTELSSR